jgi:hypothetical protein
VKSRPTSSSLKLLLPLLLTGWRESDGHLSGWPSCAWKAHRTVRNKHHQSCSHTAGDACGAHDKDLRLPQWQEASGSNTANRIKRGLPLQQLNLMPHPSLPHLPLIKTLGRVLQLLRTPPLLTVPHPPILPNLGIFSSQQPPNLHLPPSIEVRPPTLRRLWFREADDHGPK